MYILYALIKRVKEVLWPFMLKISENKIKKKKRINIYFKFIILINYIEILHFQYQTCLDTF